MPLRLHPIVRSNSCSAPRRQHTCHHSLRHARQRCADGFDAKFVRCRTARGCVTQTLLVLLVSSTHHTSAFAPRLGISTVAPAARHPSRRASTVDMAAGKSGRQPNPLLKQKDEERVNAIETDKFAHAAVLLLQATPALFPSPCPVAVLALSHFWY